MSHFEPSAGGISQWSILIALFIAAFPLHVGATGTSVLGVLEEPQCKEDGGPLVRPLYAQQGHGWISLSDEDDARGVTTISMSWMMAFDGKSLGEVKTIDPGFNSQFSWTYSRDRLLKLVEGQSIQFIENKVARFSGWCQAPHNRPLVVVSNGGFADPSVWKPARLLASISPALFGVFKAKAGKAFFCPNDVEKSVAYRYSSSDVEVVSTYSDKDGRKIVTLRLKPRKNALCDGPTEIAWNSHTFVLGKSIGYLGAGIELVDAGDYDLDGQSEVLFWSSGYNKDGYILYSKDFQERTEFLWNYH